MKIAIITDLHFGCRSDSKIFLDSQEKFYSEIFFPYIDKHNIKVILNLGDTFDRRKYINFLTLARSKQFYFDEIAKRGIDYHSVVGNHDCHYNNTNEINSLSLLCQEYPQFSVYTKEPVELTFGSTKFLMSPWITKDNAELSGQAFKNSTADVLAGHFEFTGFEMMKGTVCEHGLNRSDFSKYELVWSGHFHHPSKNGNIEYLGAPYEMTWTDYNGTRGFHVFDTETRKLERIHNPIKIFNKIYYDDQDLTVEEINELDPGALKNTYVKLIVKNTTNPYLFELFFNKIQAADPVDLKTIEDTLNLESMSEEELISEQKDTKTLLHECVDQLFSEEVDKDGKGKKIKAALDLLYNEAINL